MWLKGNTFTMAIEEYVTERRLRERMNRQTADLSPLAEQFLCQLRTMRALTVVMSIDDAQSVMDDYLRNGHYTAELPWHGHI